MQTQRMEKTSIIPGGTPITDEHGNHVFDQKGRPLWGPAKPIKHVTHFKSAGMRRLYEAGEVSLQQATHNVPVYRGVGIDIARMVRSHKRRQRKKGIIQRGRESMQQARQNMLDTKRRAMAKQAARTMEEKAANAKRDPKDLTPETAAHLVELHGSVRAAAEMSGYSRDTISRRLKKRK